MDDEKKKMRAAFAKSVLQIRQSRKWSQRELAARLRFSQAKIARVETGRAEFSMVELRRFLDVLEISLAELLAGKTESQPAVYVNEYRQAVAHRIRAYREARGLTVANTARLMRSNRVRWHMVEKGQLQLDVTELQRLSAIFNIPPEALL